MENMLKQLYQEMIERLNLRVRKEDEAVIQDMYQKYLDMKYKPLIDALKKETESDDQVYKTLLAMEKNKWKGMPGTYVYSVLLPDAAFSELQRLSSLAQKKAVDKKKTGKMDENDYTYDVFNQSVEKCMADIKDYNQESAKKLLSEILLDIRYAYGKSDVMSLRLVRVV
jgi:hypothetical protein